MVGNDWILGIDWILLDLLAFVFNVGVMRGGDGQSTGTLMASKTSSLKYFDMNSYVIHESGVRHQMVIHFKFLLRSIKKDLRLCLQHVI